ncbi:MAG: hypothetical protein FJ100_14980 [Deltaproteobacteria bacterium]|nr:hypothetical protein [Deltaproteobacteria bacterium]
MPTAPIDTARCALGLWDGHDAGAALVVEGRVVAAVSEERLMRTKRQAGFPRRAVVEVLRLAGLGPSQVQAIGIAGQYGRAPARLLDERYASLDPREIDPLDWSSRLFAQYQHTVAGLPGVRAVERLVGVRALSHSLAECGLGAAPVRAWDHHLCHALGAAARGPLPALVMTADGYGDGLSAAVWRATARGPAGLQRLATYGPSSSLALLYGAATRVLGFAEGEEGKVTGLAAAGDAMRSGSAGVGQWVRSEAGQVRVDLPAAVATLRKAIAAGAQRSDVAADVQRAVQAATVRWVQHWLGTTGLVHLAVAGGLFANVSINGALLDSGCATLTVCPAMGDQGLCVGAALASAGSLADQPWSSLRLGTDIAAGAGPDPEVVAEALAGGEVWGIARGPMEFGPRALGGRSILCDPRQRRAVDDLNARLGRDTFMPLGPVLPVEAWPAMTPVPWSRMPASAADMTVAVPVRPAFAELAPAVVHLDSTARPQAVDPSVDPWLHTVLVSFAARTGCPALVNTSFNRHGEPIVCTGDEARATARATRLDAVVVGDAVERLAARS